MLEEVKQGNKKKKLHISLDVEIFNKLIDMSKYYGMSIPNIIRIATNDYYDEKYRKVFFGYQSGVNTSKERSARSKKRNEIESMMVSFEQMNEEEATKFIYEIGYITEEEKKDGVFWSIKFNEAKGMRCLYQCYPSGGSREVWDWNELRSQILKHLKDNQKK